MQYSLLPFGGFIFVALYFITILSSFGNGIDLQPKQMFVRGIRIDINDFAVEEDYKKTAVSLVACGAQYSIAKEKVEYQNEVNGFHYDEESKLCQIGKVSFPVEEFEQGGIRVHGIRKQAQYQILFWGTELDNGYQFFFFTEMMDPIASKKMH